MTVFEFMPTLWLCSAFIFFVFLTVFGVDNAAVGLSSCLASLFASLLSLPMSVQCGIFFIWSGIILLMSRPSKKKTNTAVAVSKIDRFGGIIKYHGKCREAYARDATHEYMSGDIIKVRDGMGFTDHSA